MIMISAGKYIRSLIFFLVVLLAGTVSAATSLMTVVVEKKAQPSPFDIKSQAIPVKLSRAALRSLEKGQELEFTTPNGRRHQITFDRIDDHGGGIRSSVGYLKDKGKDFRVIITSGATGTFGSITTPGTVYRIVPGQDGQDLLVDMTEELKHVPRIDLSDDMRFPPAARQPRKKNVPIASASQSAMVGGGQGTVLEITPAPQAIVDIMFVYTPGLAARLGPNLMTRFYNLVAAANTAYADSEVAMTMRLVNATMVNHPDPPTNVNDDGVALNAITPVSGGGGGVFANVETIRNAVGADLVALMRNGLDFGGHGVAWIATSSTTADASFMYSVITGCVVGCESVFIHEMSHNMGNLHDRATAAFQDGGVPDNTLSGGAFSYSFGHFYCASGFLNCNPNVPGGCTSQPTCSDTTQNFVNPNNVGTIMSYFDPITLKFSNPNLMCAPAGGGGPQQPCGTANQNNALSMNNVRTLVQGVKSTQIATVPGALQFSQSSYSVAETAGNASITVSRVGGSVGAVSVDYTITDGTAKVGFDYMQPSQPQTLSWANGDIADKIIVIPIINDGVTEGGESFTVTLVNPAGATGIFMGNPTNASVQINENIAWPPGGTFPAGFTAPVSASGAWAVENVGANCATGQAPCLGSPAVISQTDFVYRNSDLNYSANFPAGTITFSYRVSSLDVAFANLQLLVDGIEAFASGGGETGWQVANVAISSGNHTVTWRFRNQLSTACRFYLSPTPPPNCADRAWIDNVVLPMFLINSSTAITSSTNPSIAGQSITFSATATGAGGTPAGVVTFRDGVNIITGCNLVATNAGVAQCVTSSLAQGSHSVTAAYSGNATYDVSTSSVLMQTVNPGVVVMAPGAPAIGTATPGNTVATVAFTPPTADGGSPIIDYTVTCNPGGLFATGTFSPLTVNGLSNGTPYNCSATARNAVNSGPSSNIAGVTPQAGAPLALVSVKSRKVHAGLGPFNLDINPGIAITGLVSVEPRVNAPAHVIVFLFNNMVNSPGTVTAVDVGMVSIGNASAALSANPNEVVVTLTGIPDKKRVTVTLANVNASFGTSASMGFLVGDVSNSRAVNASDISGVKAQVGQPVSINNFRFDLNSTGDITASDVSIVKSRSGEVLP